MNRQFRKKSFSAKIFILKSNSDFFNSILFSLKLKFFIFFSLWERNNCSSKINKNILIYACILFWLVLLNPLSIIPLIAYHLIQNNKLYPPCQESQLSILLSDRLKDRIRKYSTFLIKTPIEQFIYWLSRDMWYPFWDMNLFQYVLCEKSAKSCLLSKIFKGENFRGQRNMIFIIENFLRFQKRN